tara:strand:- start:159994 stop:160383 length:390 start_codon:yes stop_codon:yes gene_type:complete
MTRQLIIGVDFDGTIVEHEYPYIGEGVPGAIETVKYCIEEGAKIVLWTMRSGLALEEAVAYLKGAGVELWGVNKNPVQKTWTTSPKAYCNIYVDDAALGCPLVHGVSARPYVDWDKVRPILTDLIEEYK